MSVLSPEFEEVSDEEAGFPEKNDENKVRDAVILGESPDHKAENEEAVSDELLKFLGNLPNNAKTKFLIWRLPDNNLAGRFRMPCSDEEICEPVYWNGESEPTNLYLQITKKNGGGVYRLRAHNGSGFVKNGYHVVTLSDPPVLSDKEKLIQQQKEKEQPTNYAAQPAYVPPAPAPPVERVNELDIAISVLEKAQKLRELTTPPPAPAAPPPVVVAAAEPAPPTKLSRSEFLIKLYENSKDEQQQARLLNAFLGNEVDANLPETTWYESLGKMALEGFASSPEFRSMAGQVVSGVFNLGAAVVASKLGQGQPATAAAPAVNQPPASPATAPPVDLEALKQPRNEPAPAPAPENEPQPQFQPAPPLAPVIPLIRIGGKK